MRFTILEPQPSEHPRWCRVVEAHSREDCRPLCDEQDGRGRHCVELRGHGGYHRALGHYQWPSAAMADEYRRLFRGDQS